MKKILFGALCATLALAGCGQPENVDDPPPSNDAGTTPAADDEPDEIGPDFPDDLVDNRQVYEQDGLQPVTLRVRIDDVAQYQYVLDNPFDPDAKVSALVQDDTFATDAIGPNATLALRGQSTRDASQKSFKLKLADKTRPWRGHTTIHLNKHVYDHTRVRNKLSFDLFTTIPHITSLRTQFVHLFINDEDQGLFTQIEDAKKSFLRAHGLDPEGTLYKVQSLDFSLLSAEVASDPVAFGEHLETKANPNPGKFMEMLDALNDDDRDIDDVIDTYFWRDNYLAWLASNVLMTNTDTNNRNFYLYSPSRSTRWYFLPWDYDCAWDWEHQPGETPPSRASHGLAQWWSPVLHNRFLRKSENAAELDRRIRSLYGSQLSPDQVAGRMEGYRDVVREFVARAPDHRGLKGAMRARDAAHTLELWSAEFDRVAAAVDYGFNAYVEGLKWPMPVWLDTAELNAVGLTFRWSESFHLQGHGLTYDFELSRTPRFADGDIVETRKNLVESRVTVPAPAAGDYYYRVIIRDDVDPDNHWQYAHNIYFAADDTPYYGVRPLVVW